MDELPETSAVCFLSEVFQLSSHVSLYVHQSAETLPHRVFELQVTET